jgi:adenosylcobyric acid synthase
MFQGTGSDVGKTILVAGLCRALSNRGLRVLPFKPQNMSNNAAVTANGGEIGRAQALQALACRVEPTTDMNPVLLKPESDGASQLIIRGEMAGTLHSNSFRSQRGELLGMILESFRRLSAAADIVLVEGAGSPAEVNLRAGDIANMGFARAAQTPVVLIGDIDRGGVIASLIGTRKVLDAKDREMIRGFIINKFRGDLALFEEGYSFIEAATAWKGFGVVPWLDAVKHCPDEDAVCLQKPGRERRGSGKRMVACPVLPRIANFDDLDPLRAEADVELVMVGPGQPIPAEADLVILAGSKATIADLASLRAEGWDVDLLAHRRRGGRILGICGGFQMLGTEIADPEGLEGRPGRVGGLGLLDVSTVLAGKKTLSRISGRLTATGARIEGYEIHLGTTLGPDSRRAAVLLDGGTPDGAVSPDGLVMGTYVHGIFGNAEARAEILAGIGARSNGVPFDSVVDRSLDEIAEALERSLDVRGLLSLAADVP